MPYQFSCTVNVDDQDHPVSFPVDDALAQSLIADGLRRSAPTWALIRQAVGVADGVSMLVSAPTLTDGTTPTAVVPANALVRNDNTAIGTGPHGSFDLND